MYSAASFETIYNKSSENVSEIAKEVVVTRYYTKSSGRFEPPFRVPFDELGPTPKRSFIAKGLTCSATWDERKIANFRRSPVLVYATLRMPRRRSNNIVIPGKISASIASVFFSLPA